MIVLQHFHAASLLNFTYQSHKKDSKTLMFLNSVFIAAVSIDCPDVINLAYGLNMDIFQPTKMADIKNDCCSAYRVTCTSQRVSEILWDNLDLNGSVNATALPPKLTNFDIHSNYLISGPFPFPLPSTLQKLFLNYNAFSGILPLIWPSTLKSIILDKNEFNGSTSSIIWPVGIRHIDLHSNNLYGDVSNIPINCKQLQLGLPNLPGNQFIGKLILNQPTDLEINYNLITDVIIYDTSLLDGSSCDLSFNPLLGNPNIGNLSFCVQNGLFKEIPVSAGNYTYSTVLNDLRSSIFTVKINAKWIIPQFDFLKYTVVHLVQITLMLFISAIFLIIVCIKTPFKREMKKKLKFAKSKEFGKPASGGG